MRTSEILSLSVLRRQLVNSLDGFINFVNYKFWSLPCLFWTDDAMIIQFETLEQPGLNVKETQVVESFYFSDLSTHSEAIHPKQTEQQSMSQKSHKN